MKTTHKMVRIFALVFLCALMTASAFAQSKQEVAASMRDRHPALMEAKNKGQVGEAWTGLVGLVSANAPAAVQKLVDAENHDRKQLFRIIAGETSASVQEVARQNRIRMYRLAKDHHFVQDANRNWVKKKALDQ
ncbi:MAG: YdbL family protein [Desulfobacterales bacterium]|nr:YdbL family protein [Desulfobacterales bacterium]